MISPPPLLQAIEDELLRLLAPLVEPGGPLTGIVVEPISTAEDLDRALQRNGGRIPVGILSMGGNATWPQGPKPAGLAAQVDQILNYTFIAAFSDYANIEKRRAEIFTVNDLFVRAIPDRAFTGLPVAQGWSVDRCEMVGTQTLVRESVYGIIYQWGIRSRAKVFPQTAQVG